MEIYMKRLLDFTAHDFLTVSPMELKQAIFLSEGRCILSENVPIRNCYLDGVSNAEIERAAGADMILFNTLDIFSPMIKGVPKDIPIQEHISWIKKAVCRSIGIVLEPIDVDDENNAFRTEIGIGHMASPATFKKAEELGFDFICLSANPKTGVSNQAIANAIQIAKKYYHGLVIAGKMHGAGKDEKIMDVEIAKQFINNHVDILLLPAPYTIPFFTESDFLEISLMVRDYNKDKNIEDKVLIMSAIGTSQDSSTTATIEKIALSAKACGADLQHIGDSFNGIALPQNIYAMGKAIRGERHQLSMLAKSNLR